MYCTYLLGLFLLLGVVGGSSSVKISQKDEALDIPDARDKSLFNITNDVSVNSRQLVEFEKTINIVYKHFFGSPPTQLSLRRSVDTKTDLASTVSIIGDTICNQTRSIFKTIGVPLSSSKVGWYDGKSRDSNSLRFTIFYQLLQMPLEIRPLCQIIKDRITEYMEINNYAKLGYAKTNFSIENFGVNSTTEWEILAILSSSNTYSAKLHECLERNNGRPFVLMKSLERLMKLPPVLAGHILTRNLEKSLPNHSSIRKSNYNEIHAFVCHATLSSSPYVYRTCLREIKHIDECVKAKIANLSLETGSQSLDEESSKNFTEIITYLDDSCVNVTGEINYSIHCDERGKMTTNDDYLYIVDFFAGDMKKSPVLRSMANEIFSSVNNTSTGVNTVREVANLIGIYEKAMKKRSKLAKTAGKDGARRYDEISENLANYKRHLASKSLKAMKDVNGIVSNVEKIVVDSMSKSLRQNSSVHVRALKCFSDLIGSFLGDWFHGPENSKHRNGTQNFTGHPKTSVSRGSIPGRNEVGFVKNSHDEPLKKWMDSMKHLGQTSLPRRSTALITLANTFLLATMFYESIALLAAAIYREDSGSVSSSFSAENEHNDNWLPRDRRMSTLTDRQDHWIPTREDQMIPVNPTTISGVDAIPKYEIPMFQKILQSYGNSSYSKIPRMIIKKGNL